MEERGREEQKEERREGRLHHQIILYSKMVVAVPMTITTECLVLVIVGMRCAKMIASLIHTCFSYY